MIDQIRLWELITTAFHKLDQALHISVGIKLNQFYTQQHRRMFPRTANKEIKIDKILQDLPICTVLFSRELARGFPDVSMERKSIDSFWS